MSVSILGDHAYLPEGGRALLGLLAAVLLSAGATSALYPTLTRLGPHVGTSRHSRMEPYGHPHHTGTPRDYWNDGGGGAGASGEGGGP